MATESCAIVGGGNGLFADKMIGVKQERGRKALGECDWRRPAII